MVRLDGKTFAECLAESVVLRANHPQQRDQPLPIPVHVDDL